MTDTPSQSSSQPRILCTGGSGFIGSCLISRLNDLGYEDITIVDRLGVGSKWRNLVGLRYTEYLEIDRFKLRMSQTRCDFDVVFALGACSSTRETNASYLMSNNLQDMIDLCGWTLFGGRRAARFIYASSAATYGSDESSDSLSPDILRPLNPYGLSKNMFDQYAARAGWLDKIVGLKYTNVMGPNCEHKGVMESFVTRAFREIKTNGKVSMYDAYLSAPDGLDARDFLYVKDAVDMTLHFAFDTDGKRASGLFNLGSGVATTWRDMAAFTCEAMGRDLSIEYKPMPPELKGKYQYYTKADISKLRASGYHKWITPAKEAVIDYVQHYLVPDLRIGERKLAASTTLPNPI